jgi:hypothetical protein
MTVNYPQFIVEYFWFPSQPTLSLLIWVLLILFIMYFARWPAQAVIRAVFRSITRLLRQFIKYVLAVNVRLRQRNRDILLTNGRELFEYKLEKNFIRIADQVARDLSVWPSLHRDMREQMTRMDSEFSAASEVPPEPPEWLRVVESVAQISAHGSDVIAKILADIHNTLKQAMEKAVIEYRYANRNRYALLNRMVPQWRGMSDNLNELDKKIERITNRAQVIDTQMQAYQQILQGTEQAAHALSKSAASNLLLSTLLLLVAAAGCVINFQLLALPLSEVVGVHGFVMGMRSSDIATMVIVFLQIILGLFLLEAAGVTRLLPDIGLLDRRKRRGIMYLMVFLLLMMSSMEALLVYTRDALVEDNAALNKLLTLTDDTHQVSLSWIPVIGQVVIGFSLPLLLIFSVIALENFINAFRTVVSMFLSWLLDVVAMLLRLMVTVSQSASQLMIALYDLIIFLPIYIERACKFWHRARPASAVIKSTEVDE